jgi:hypothetical protein
MVGEGYEAALAKAQEGLAEEADYLLLLGVSAEASVGLGDTDGAREFYSDLLGVYDTEIGLDRLGYDHHRPMLSAYREAAQAFLNQG